MVLVIVFSPRVGISGPIRPYVCSVLVFPPGGFSDGFFPEVFIFMFFFLRPIWTPNAMKIGKYTDFDYVPMERLIFFCGFFPHRVSTCVPPQGGTLGRSQIPSPHLCPLFFSSFLFFFIFHSWAGVFRTSGLTCPTSPRPRGLSPQPPQAAQPWFCFLDFDSLLEPRSPGFPPLPRFFYWGPLVL